MARPLKLLLFSTLYPSAARPLHGPFVETRLQQLRLAHPVEATVIAPVPWFPFTGERWGEYAQFARTPQHEERQGVAVWHPRYPLLPKVGMNTAPTLMAASALRLIRRLMARGLEFDLIDAHYFYPDGVAAARIAQALGKPLVITARGTDVNLIPQYPLPRRMIQWAAGQAGAVIGVSGALVETMAALGIPREKLHTVRNGVDLQRFAPQPVDEARRTLGIEGGPVVLSVGNLVENKGHDRVMRAVASLVPAHPGIRLVVCGRGPEAARLGGLATDLGIADRVRLAGGVPNTELKTWYSAADVLVLASSREGWPNVLLEAMASGAPVLATRVGGIPEVLAGCPAGGLVDDREPATLAAALQALLARGAEQRAEDRRAVRRHAEAFGWGPTSQAQVQIFESLLARPQPAWQTRHA